MGIIGVFPNFPKLPMLPISLCISLVYLSKNEKKR